MKCPRQAQNPSDGLFCEECGSRLEALCPRVVRHWGYSLHSSTYDRLGYRRLRGPRSPLTIAA